MATSALITTFEKDNCPSVHLVRPEVAEFAIEMEEVLQNNDHKTGWTEMSIDDIFFRIKDEFEELDEAHAMYVHPLISDGEASYAIQDMHKECIDMSNFCMFLCHNYPKKDV